MALEMQLHRHEDWLHLRVHGKDEALIIVDADGSDVGRGDPLVRIEVVGEHVYALSIRWHDGRWQRLPECTAERTGAIANLRADYGSLLTAL